MDVLCWIIGDEETFTIFMSPTQSVPSLQNSIKYKKPVRFHNMDPDDFYLYSIPYSEDEDHLERLKSAWQNKDRIILEPEMKVSMLESRVVIVGPLRCADPPVIVPVMTLTCGLHGLWSNDLFHFEVPRTVTVGFLQQVIKSQEGGSINAKSLALYKVSIPCEYDYRETVKNTTLDEDKWLNPMTVLSDAFSDDPVQQHIHIIIKVLSTISHKRALHNLELHRLEERRQKFLDDFSLEVPSPSPFLEKGPLIDRQDDPKRAIHWNRPHSAMSAIPVTLLHPVFGQFLDDCETYKPSPRDNSLAMDLQEDMSAYHIFGYSRARAFREAFMRRDLDLDTSAESYETDMGVQYFDHVIMEFMNEVGSLGEDPYHQASLRYLESTGPHAPRLENSALPSLIVIAIGPFIAFAGAAWNTRPVIQPLSVSLPLHYHDTDKCMQTRVARHLGAFRKAAHALEEYYECLEMERGVPYVNQLFPYRTHFRGNDGQLVNFEYDEQASESRLLFFGRFGDDRPICIKFVTRYSKDAHLVCASLGCAPILHGFETLPGGWLMVVMDRLLPEEYMAFGDITPTTSLVKNIRGALKQLHKSEYVHGDLRDLNIMVSKRDKTKFMLVDFDWAGRIGEVCYPANVNRTDLWRPRGAVDGALIDAWDDMDMLDDIVETYGVTD